MAPSLLATKLHVPPPPTRGVARPDLLRRLDAGLDRTLTLVSAPAGAGKTSLVSQWLAGVQRPVAWLSFDEDDDLGRFLVHLVCAVRTVVPEAGAGVLTALRSPQPPTAPALLTALINDLASSANEFVLVLDDYHLVDAPPVDAALAFLVAHLPRHVHLVVVSRADPPLPLGRLRARGQLSELRARDLRFDAVETGAFLHDVMGLSLSAEDVAALQRRTEGWIAGLQLAAISLEGREDAAGYIRSFTGSQRYVMDYLIEEVLERLPAHLQTFLLRTSVLGRLCGALCDAVVGDAVAGHAARPRA